MQGGGGAGDDPVPGDVTKAALFRGWEFTIPSIIGKVASSLTHSTIRRESVVKSFREFFFFVSFTPELGGNIATPSPPFLLKDTYIYTLLCCSYKR